MAQKEDKTRKQETPEEKKKKEEHSGREHRTSGATRDTTHPKGKADTTLDRKPAQ